MSIDSNLIWLIGLAVGCAVVIAFWRARSNNYELTIKAKDAEIDTKNAEIARLENESVPSVQNRIQAFKETVEDLQKENETLQIAKNNLEDTVRERITVFPPATFESLTSALNVVSGSANTFTNMSQEMFREFMKDAAENTSQDFKDFTNVPFQRMQEEKPDDEDENGDSST